MKFKQTNWLMHTKKRRVINNHQALPGDSLSRQALSDDE
jgi:hypothetical protein